MNPYQTYQRQQQPIGWTRIDMLLALYDGAIERLTSAIDLLNAGDKLKALPYFSKSQLIVNALASAVRQDMSDELAMNLLRLYEFCVHRISLGESAPAAEALKVLKTLREGFDAIRAESVTLERHGKVPPADLLRTIQTIA